MGLEIHSITRGDHLWVDLERKGIIAPSVGFLLLEAAVEAQLKRGRLNRTNLRKTWRSEHSESFTRSIEDVLRSSFCFSHPGLCKTSRGSIVLLG